MRKLLLIPALALLSALGWAQGSYTAFPVQTATGVAIAGASVALCASQPDSSTPCGGAALQPTYTDITLTSVCAEFPVILGPTYGPGCTNPGQADGFGMVRWYASGGFYYYQAYGQGIVVPDVEPILLPGTGGGVLPNPIPPPLIVGGSSFVALTPDPYCAFNLGPNYPDYICELLSGSLVFAPNGPNGTLQRFAFRNMAQSFTAAQSFPAGLTSGSDNAILNPVACSASPTPTWCSGSDIGAWTNAAIATLPTVAGGACGEVYIPAGGYSYTTPIILPRCVKLHGAAGAGTILTYTPTTGCAIVVADSNATGSSAYSPEGAIEDLTLGGPGSGTSTCGIYFGGSDGSATAPPIGIDPSTNYGDHFSLNRVKIYKVNPAGGFGVGLQWGTNAWSNTVFESVVSFNGTGLLFPSTITNMNSGEEIAVTNSSVSNNVGVGVMIGNVGGGNAINVTITNSSLDFNGSWAVENGTAGNSNVVSMMSDAIYSNDHWIQNYGIFNIEGAYFVGGSNSGTLGYLIDNQAAVFVSIGGQYLNSGTGVLANAAGTGGYWITPFTGGGAMNFYAYLVDRFGNIFNNVTTSTFLVSNVLNQSAANKLAGVSACVGSTKAITFPITYTSQPAIVLFDETTKGGVNLTAKSTSGFTASCTGATDAFDWIVIGNPN